MPPYATFWSTLFNAGEVGPSRSCVTMLVSSEEVNYFNLNVVGFLCSKLLFVDNLVEENLPRVGWSLP